MREHQHPHRSWQYIDKNNSVYSWRGSGYGNRTESAVSKADATVSSGGSNSALVDQNHYCKNISKSSTPMRTTSLFRITYDNDFFAHHKNYVTKLSRNYNLLSDRRKCGK